MRKTWKIVLSLTLVLALSLMLFACNTDDAGEQDNSTPPPSNEEESGTEQGMNMLGEKVQKRVNEIYSSATTDAQSISSVQELAIITSINYSRGTGPITVTPATLDGEEITLVTLSGTEFKEGQATTINESKLASMGENNDYLRAVVKLFKNNTIPRSKPVLVAGISLGGMIAQQLLGESYVTRNYDIVGIVTFGSPITLPLSRRGVPVVRFTDSDDMVPKAGELGIYNSVRGTAEIARLKADIVEADAREKIVEQAKVGNPIETHALSYIDAPCWDKYDILGSTEHRSELVLTAPITFYEAPIITK